MICQNETDFAQRLKTYGPRGVYFLYGEQNYLKKLYVKKIVDQAVESTFADFNLTRLEGTAGLDAISDAVEALPMMAAQKCVVVNDLDVPKLAATEASKLAELLAEPPTTTVLVFTTTELIVDVKKSAKWKSFIKQVDAVGNVVELGNRSGSDLNRFLRTLAERAGCSIETENCTYLVERCGKDMQVLKNEIDKLCAYRGTGQITREDIRLCSVAQLEASVFDLSKFLLRGDYRHTMRSLSDLLDLREEPVAILGALSGSFVDLYRAKVAKENAVSLSDLCGSFKCYKGREWRMKNAWRDCDRFTKRQLWEIVELLARADFRLKSSRGSQAVVLQETITRISACCAGRREARR